MDTHWIVLRVISARAQMVQARIGLLGLSAFLPLYRRITARRGRVRKIAAPLFPGYLFVEKIGPWEHSVSVADVLGLLTNDGKPSVVSAGEIAALRARVGADGLIALHGAERFRLGQLVSVQHGALAGVSGRYAGARKGKELVEVALFGATRVASVDVGALTAA